MVAKVDIFFDSTNFLQIFCEILFDFKKMPYLCTRKTETECSAVGSALRSGRRGRAFESPHSDKVKGSFLEYSKLPFIIFRLSGRNRNSRTEIYQPIISWRTDSTFWRQQHSLCCVSVAQRLKWLILRMRRQSLRLSWVGVPGMLSE